MIARRGCSGLPAPATIIRQVVAIELNPQEVIVPVLGRDSPDANLRFLGTGSIVGDGSILLTADHVVAGCPGQHFITTVPGHLVEVELDAKDPNPLWPIEVAERDGRHDLALLRINGYRSNNPLTLWFEFPLHENWDVLTYEYSTTREEQGHIRLSPAARRGHITLMVNVDKLGPAAITRAARLSTVPK
jgi:Trypsin-like peptidase domain